MTRRPSALGWRSCTRPHAEAVHVPLAPLCHYIIVRSDLPRGIQAAQIAHAAGESSPGHLPSGTHAIVLTCPGEAELSALGRYLEWARVPHVRIEEPDAPYAGALMSIGLRPARKEEIRRFVSSLPLLR